MKISRETMSALANYSWPGNVRELENLIERLVVLKEDETIVMTDLPEKIAGGFNNHIDFKSAITNAINSGNIDFDKRVTDFEKYIISHAIKSAKGVKSRAARLLNIKRTTLVEK